MSSLADIITWPDTLPLPFVDYDGIPRHVTLASKTENPKILRRRRFVAHVVEANVQWVLGIAEYAEFKAFLLDTLGNGAAQFLIELKYPKTSELTFWKARFLAGYSSEYQDGHWVVSGNLQLADASLTADSDAAPLLDWINFFVMPPETPFATADDFLYCVKV